jgi:UDP-N-acetylmuramoyl-tripeptide--D-alanyl-D-alanine ligase
MRIRCSELAAAVGGRLDGPDVVVDGASVDSRTVRPGQLFVAVVAERDGHAFVADAVAAGAVASLVSEPGSVGGVAASAVVVEDTVAALQAAGRFARDRLGGPVIGITGSVGKTSVKDVLAGVLSRRRVTAASAQSFNNELGVPLTLLDAPDDTEVAVVEMGARGIGHIALLCDIAAPTIGVVTRVAAAHTEEFGSLEAIAQAKGELVEALPAEGTAVLCAFDERVAAMAARTSARVVTFGAGGDVVAEEVRLDDELRPRFHLRTPWGEVDDVELATRGLHQVDNALAATAAALACGLDLTDVVAGLAEAQLSPWRMELGVAPGGGRVLNDAYNANPASTEAALRSLAALPATRHVAVLGIMAELGDQGPAAHEAVAALAEALGVEVVAVAAPAYGRATHVTHVPDLDAALAAVGPLGRDDAVLVKGSRVAGLEALATRLLTP